MNNNINANKQRLFLYKVVIFIKAWCLFFKWNFIVSYYPYKYWKKALFQHKNEDIDETTNNSHCKSLHKRRFNHALLLIRISEKAGRNHYKLMNCLRRCLVQQALLKSYQIPSEIKLGVLINNEILKAHTWLTVDGKVINDSPAVVEYYSELNKINDVSVKSLV